MPGTEQTQTQTSQEATQQSSGTNQQTNTPNYEEQFNSIKTEYETYKKEAEQYKTGYNNAVAYFKADPVGSNRVQKWIEGKPFDDEQAQPVKPEKKAAELDPKAYEQEILKKAEGLVEERIAPFRDFRAEMEARQNKESVLNEYQWADEKTYDSFTQKFEEIVRAEANDLQQKYNLSPNKAYEMAVGQYVGYSHGDLFMKVMKDEILENAAKSGRGPTALPKGMTSRIGNAAGPNPALMDQARKAYKANPRNAEEIMKEFAPQLNMDPLALYKQLSEE